MLSLSRILAWPFYPAWASCHYLPYISCFVSKLKHPVVHFACIIISATLYVNVRELTFLCIHITPVWAMHCHLHLPYLHTAITIISLTHWRKLNYYWIITELSWEYNLAHVYVWNPYCKYWLPDWTKHSTAPRAIQFSIISGTEETTDMYVDNYMP